MDPNPPRFFWKKDKNILLARPWKSQRNRRGYPVLGGWLRKSTRKGQWKKRWFRLQASYLVYYKSSTSQKPLGFLDMNEINSVTRCFGPTKHKTTTELVAASESSVSTISSSSSKSATGEDLSTASPHFAAVVAAAPTSPASLSSTSATTAISSSSNLSTTEDQKNSGEHYLILATKTNRFKPLVLIVEHNPLVSEPSVVASWYNVLSITIAAVSSGVDRATSSSSVSSEDTKWTHNWHVESVALCDELLRSWVAGSEGVSLNSLNDINDINGSKNDAKKSCVLGTKLMRHPTRYSLTVHIEEKNEIPGLGIKRYLSGTAIFPTSGSLNSGILLVPCKSPIRLLPINSNEITADMDDDDDDPDDYELETDLVAEIYWSRIPIREKSIVRLFCGFFCNEHDPQRWLQAHKPIFPALVRSMHPYAMEGALTLLVVLLMTPIVWISGCFNSFFVLHVPYRWTIFIIFVLFLMQCLYRSKHRDTLLQCFDWYRQDQFEITSAAVLKKLHPAKQDDVSIPLLF